ncbi:MAG TPA: hypothetical protein VH025_08695 [Solirubrobacteraceae bacterium]|nr:hypothetical protein [Solirubrobacteraceae bacterium]
MDIDRQAIERRDFPITRRGYEPAAVDAHLRALAGEIEQLQRELSDGGGQASLASTAGTQVQSILAAAESAAAELERDADDDARSTREEAARDAASTREKAINQARGQVAFVTKATAALLERINSMDTEVATLVESVRTSAGRLSADLGAVEQNMGELYDAAAGNDITRAVAGEPAQPSVPTPAPAGPSTPQLSRPTPPSSPATPEQPPTPPPLSPPETTEPEVHLDPEAPAADNGDLDGARLIALNMALNGESREDADRYLAANFELADRGKLVDEVFAAIES